MRDLNRSIFKCPMQMHSSCCKISIFGAVVLLFWETVSLNRFYIFENVASCWSRSYLQQVSVTKWCIVGYWTGALLDLWRVHYSIYEQEENMACNKTISYSTFPRLALNKSLLVPHSNNVMQTSRNKPTIVVISSSHPDGYFVKTNYPANA